MKEYSNPRFAELLKLLAGIIADGQAKGSFVNSVPAPIAARMIFGVIDELALTWLLGGGEKFDIVPVLRRHIRIPRRDVARVGVFPRAQDGELP